MVHFLGTNFSACAFTSSLGHISACQSLCPRNRLNIDSSAQDFQSQQSKFILFSSVPCTLDADGFHENTLNAIDSRQQEAVCF